MASMSIIRADVTSYFIEFFRNLPDFVFEEIEPESDSVEEKLDSDSTEEKHDSDHTEEKHDSDSTEEKPSSDSMEDKPDPEFVVDDHGDESMLVLIDENENGNESMLVDEDEDSDTEGPWYRDRGDVKCIGDILVGFIKEKIKYSLIKQAAASYVAKENELTDRHKRRKLLLGQQEYSHCHTETADKAILEILVKQLVFGPRDQLSQVEAADRTTLETLVKGIVENIAEKMRPFIIHEYIESKKKRWIEQCGTHNVDKLIEFSQFHKYPFYINVSGFYEKEVGKAGFGVIIREFRGYPLAAYSEYICDNESQVSSFYHELQGVNKGLELAIELNLEYFRIFTTQTDIGFLVMSCQTYENQCHCDPKGLKAVEKRCERCVRRCVYFCQDVEMNETEVEKIYLLLIQVMDQLRRLGRSNVSVMCQSSFNTRSASYLAKRDENKGEIDMKSGDLQRHPELREILFSEASGEHGSNVFSLSLFW